MYLAELISARLSSSKNNVIHLWIGPEGGFSDHENECLAECGVMPISVGDYTLRIETAVVACISLLIGANKGYR